MWRRFFLFFWFFLIKLIAFAGSVEQLMKGVGMKQM